MKIRNCTRSCISGDVFHLNILIVRPLLTIREGDQSADESEDLPVDHNINPPGLAVRESIRAAELRS